MDLLNLLLLALATFLDSDLCSCARPSEPTIMASSGTLNDPILKNRTLAVKAAVSYKRELRNLNYGMQNIYTNHLKDHHVGCNELRSKRYISDGQCTSPRPILDVICADWCLKPVLPADASDYLARFRHADADPNPDAEDDGDEDDSVAGDARKKVTPVEKWRCVNAVTKQRKVRLVCRDGTRRVYHVIVVSRCKCTRQAQLREQEDTIRSRTALVGIMKYRRKLHV